MHGRWVGRRRRLAGGALRTPICLHGPNCQGEARQIAERVIALPLTRRAIAKQDLVAVFAQGFPAIPELVAYGLDVLSHARQEQPAWTCVHRLRVRLEALGGVVFWVDADGVEENVAPERVT